ncbi:hypothetical protein FKM82_020201 [Ascaphus truei]
MFKLSVTGRAERKRAREAGEKVQVVRSNANWILGFTVFGDCFLSKHPKQLHNVMKYLNVIQTIHDEHGGSVWWDYGEQFRQRWQGDTRLSLGKMDMELWMKLVG